MPLELLLTVQNFYHATNFCAMTKCQRSTNGCHNPANCRAARALLGWSQDELATKARVGRSTIASFESANWAPYRFATLLRLAGERFEDAGIEFLDPIEGMRGEGVCFKWGVAPQARQPGEDAATGGEGEGGLKAAWDEGEEAADLDALLSEAPAPDPDMAEMWRTAPELWAQPVGRRPGNSKPDDVRGLPGGGRGVFPAAALRGQLSIASACR